MRAGYAERGEGACARLDELEVALDVEAVAGRHLLLRHHLLDDGGVVPVDALVAGRGEPLLRRAEDGLAARRPRALLAVDARVVALGVHARGVALQVGIVLVADAVARAAGQFTAGFARARLVAAAAER